MVCFVDALNSMLIGDHEIMEMRIHEYAIAKRSKDMSNENEDVLLLTVHIK